ncbi:hypothetical protein EN836_19155 [Mesorhizobium sp. M1C.F.Ca.ET.193.01.1.1]|uniref:hypothetical protein n=1 Tax=unclassified Mesorhizobium TaxID=325217 RepID=UPI000FD4E43C|nr:MULTISPECIES: hypothetical protein [unclassified Mesorhizobium]TGS97379.1 hypothetical protein EN820_39240 [bacterium M00.F.Ca.ET.177.01.1.1]TGQ52549.1 hypothetical protein EN853_19150 [Mesorhizobium sp. M1C.F.Ca.ET.210.01.1.1]TGQ69172.1 hypothetical protein EN855_019160 [Mesorhizobium sp. M1C.F.Ca.ET.212.01.1.1]TGR05187.1 hypothetical protein EN847_19155 [Mesorhizobium sp. M1C.F.Ca.ET.204.01.1.1]TGR25792.1 hypothetical protein EN839_19155 [Mesorhizobium sp. M1C.F.Ca.ET.196.01.1.1]
MKIILPALSALLLTLVPPQAAPAKAKTLVTECNTDKHRPLLDEKATGGIVPSPGQTAKAAEPGQAYPPPLDLHF